MLVRRSPRLAPTWAALTLLSLLGACSGKQTRHPDGQGVLTTADGVEITYQSTRCIYRQGTGANTTLSLQIQYLDSPDTVAFALYIDDPPPAHPFRATPGEVGAWILEVALDGKMYSNVLQGAEVTLSLDTLPAPSTLTPGQTVRLHGELAISALSLPPQPDPGKPATAPLELAGGSVPLDCEASYDESLTLD